MAVRICYKIRTKKKVKSIKSCRDEVTIYMRVTNGRKYDHMLATDYVVPLCYWDSKLGAIKDGVVCEDEAMVKFLSATAKDLAELKVKVWEDAKNYIEYPKERLQSLINSDKLDAIKEGTKIPKDMLEYLDYVIKGMSDGSVRNKGDKYNSNTIKAWSSFRKIFAEFYKALSETEKKPTWANLSERTYIEFISYLEDCEYMPSTINKYIITFKALVNMAAENELHSNLAPLKKFHKIKVKDEEQAARIYLTDEEIDALYKMQLEEGSLRCYVRDIFLCGAYTGQRISDYNNLTADNFRKSEAKGYDVVSLTQKKTGNKVVVPVLNSNLLNIVEKYKYNLPRVHDVVLNKEIKNILKELSKTVTSLTEKIPTMLTIKEKYAEQKGNTTFERDSSGNVVKARYDLVSSHTARRSCVTNLYLSNKYSVAEIMSISGHKTEKAFREYIRCSADTIAEGIIEK